MGTCPGQYGGVIVDEILFLCNEPLITRFPKPTYIQLQPCIVKHNSVSTDMYVPDNFPRYMDSQKRLHICKLQISGRFYPAYNRGMHLGILSLS